MSRVLRRLVTRLTRTAARADEIAAQESITSVTGLILEQALRSGPTLVEFWAPWSGPAYTLAPRLKQLERDLGERAVVVKVSLEESPETFVRYEVRKLPSFILFVGGREVIRTLTPPPLEEILARIERAKS